MEAFIGEGGDLIVELLESKESKNESVLLVFCGAS
jgi:hypothetical protein